jgi:protein tyrosine/serine phosphatase
MKRVLKRSIYITAGALVAFAAYITIQIQTGNFHEVVKGDFYRSGQPSAADINRYAKRHGIKSIINLRGANEDADWYKEELAASSANGITHINFRMKAARELTNEQAIELIELMRNAPKPLLVHCLAGADRTGLASAFYIAGVVKLGEETAERQLWLHYGHLPFYINEAFAMNRSFERMEPYFGFHDS